MSIRLRLTLWYTVILALVLTGFSLGIYLFMSWQMAKQVDSRLLQAANTVPVYLARATSASAQIVERGNQKVLSIPALDAFQASDIYVQLNTSDGHVFAVSPNIVNASLSGPLDGQALKQAVANGGTFSLYTDTKLEGAPIRVYSQYVDLPATSRLPHLSYKSAHR